jgi:hypothetical protein
MLARSADGGKSWSDPLVVNDDSAWGGGRRGPDHLQPLVAVNRNGVVAVSWYDRRDHPDNIGWDVRFSVSLDGGESWAASTKVSEFGYRADGRAEYPVIVLSRGGGNPISKNASGSMSELGFEYFEVDYSRQTGGDTAGLTADASGTFHPVWVDNRTGVAQLWTAAIAVRGTVTTNGSPELASLERVSPYVMLDYAAARYDPAAHRLRVDAKLTNTSTKALRGPIYFRLTSLTSRVGTPRVLNADDGAARMGATWIFHAAGGDVVPPGASTEIRRLEFRLFGVDESYSQRPLVKLSGEALAARAVPRSTRSAARSTDPLATPAR